MESKQPKHEDTGVQKTRESLERLFDVAERGAIAPESLSLPEIRIVYEIAASRLQSRLKDVNTQTITVFRQGPASAPAPSNILVVTLSVHRPAVRL